MEKNIIIPPHFQCPNFYVDVLDEYLTAEESKVLIHAVREILGWRDSLQTRQKHIARDIFFKGRVVNGKKVYGGVNLCKESIEAACNALHKYRILVRVGSSRDPRGQLYELTDDVSKIDIAGLEQRKAEKHAENSVKTAKLRAKQSTRLSHRQEAYSPVTQATYSPVTQATYSPVTQATYSPVTQAERKTEKEIHGEKDREREQQPKPQTSPKLTNTLALSNSPCGVLYLEFFGEASANRLNSTQIKMIAEITDASLFRQAVERLVGNGYQVALKIPLIKKVMTEIAAETPSAITTKQASQPGASSPGIAAPRLTAKEYQRQQNLARLAAMKTAVSVTIEQPEQAEKECAQ